LPLTEEVSFKATLQEGSRVQIPRVIRWQYKMDPDQVLRVQVGSEKFFAQMSRDGRILIPKLARALLEDEGGLSNLVGAVLEVTLEPLGLLKSSTS
jgi:bifunctional DNA-binding transcriptional regulator/antitoxin component of YhaV-PrlF toxin-antitoxin module